MDPLPNLPKLPFHTNVSSSEKAKVLTDPNKTFTLVYWEIAAVGSTAREMLAAYCPKWQWKHEAVNDDQWAAKEVPTPFSCLPYLKVTSAAGEEVVLSEAMIVDQYLAEELGLLGDNKYESWTILAFNSNIHYFTERSFIAFAQKDHASRKKGRESFMAGALRKFIRDHEFHLQNNGNNGHYVGNRLSLADIHLANAVHYFQTFPCGKIIEDMFRESEPIWKVVETVLANPEIATWRKTTDFKQLERGSVEWYAQYAIPGEDLPSCFKEESSSTFHPKHQIQAMIPFPKIALHTDVSSADVSKALTDPNKTFTFVYWEIVSVGGTARDILAYSKTKNWKSEHPTMEKWKAKEFSTPLSYFPILKMTASTGQEIVLAEAMVIDVYLAEEFGLLGDNKYEELTIKAFHSSVHFLMERFFRSLSSTAERKQNIDTFIDCFLPKFIYDHEFHLRNNGNNGHYVGNKLSLADIHLANAIHLFQTMPFGKRIDDVFCKSVPIRKVLETVLANPEIAAWRNSDEFKRLEKGSHEWYAPFTIPDSPTKD